MDFPWWLIVVAFGFGYGALKPGRQDKSRVFLVGLLIGVILAIILVVIGFLTKVWAIGALAVLGGIGIVLMAVVLALLFVLGVWLGDLVTRARRA